MSSYADVTGSYIPPGEQPKPDPNLDVSMPDSTTQAKARAAVGEPGDNKVGVASLDSDDKGRSTPQSAESREDAIKRVIDDAEDKAVKDGKKIYNKSSEKIKKWEKEGMNEIRKPEVYRSVVGITNLALIAGLGISAYQNWNKVWDRKVVAGIVIGFTTLFGAEGYLGFLDYKKHKKQE